MVRMERATAHLALLPPQALAEAAESFAEEGAGAGGAVGGLGAVALEVGVALPLLAACGCGGRTGGRRGRAPAQETRWAAVGKRVMSRPVVRHEVAHSE